MDDDRQNRGLNPSPRRGPALRSLHPWPPTSSGDSESTPELGTRARTSALYTGERRSKDDQIFEALDAIDELSSYLVGGEFCEEAGNRLEENLEKIQCILLDAGANVATPRGSASQFKLTRTEFDVDGTLMTELEDWIDA
ncbi:hypothetical protein BC830DRAFT_1165354 [Chytriomyces sp. MP71]|nr:hypothetical protein BC830DRAFT_1165354 [Chytriomyces sp. MP71]